MTRTLAGLVTWIEVRVETASIVTVTRTDKDMDNFVWKSSGRYKDREGFK